jgi:hypothetical protein
MSERHRGLEETFLEKSGMTSAIKIMIEMAQDSLSM